MLLNTLRFLDANFYPRAITVSPDLNKNGSYEISVMGVGKGNNVAKVETRDSKTGEVLNDTKF